MAVKKYTATKDNTITNAFGEIIGNRLTGTNAGLADVVEVFSIFGQLTSSVTGNEKSRALLEFSTTTIQSDITDSTIQSGSNFVLRMFNAATPSGPPTNFTLLVAAVSRSWTEGAGPNLANKNYTGVSNWNTASTGVDWTSPGGDYHASPTFSASFTTGNEDLELDITTLVNQWLEGTKTNNGLGVYLISNDEESSASYFTKMFYSRTSEYTSKHPVIEARYDGSKRDDARTFYLSSALAPAADNLNDIYLYNYGAGQLTNLPYVGTGKVLISIYSGTSSPIGSKLNLPYGGGITASGDTNITGTYVSTGIYSASFAYASSSITTIFPVWHSSSVEYATGSGVVVLGLTASSARDFSDYSIMPANLKPIYTTSEKARIRLYIRPKDWTSTIYPNGTRTLSSSLLDNIYYEITRNSDGLKIIPYGTGSGDKGFTRLSYDIEGNYFDFDFSQLEAGYRYCTSFVIKKDSSFIEQADTFEFRVD